MSSSRVRTASGEDDSSIELLLTSVNREDYSDKPNEDSSSSNNFSSSGGGGGSGGDDGDDGCCRESVITCLRRQESLRLPPGPAWQTVKFFVGGVLLLALAMALLAALASLVRFLVVFLCWTALLIVLCVSAFGCMLKNPNGE